MGLDHIVVVGASLAGCRAAEELRTLGHAGTITPRRRRAAPSLRPPAAVEAGAGRHEAARVDRALGRPAARSTTSTSTGAWASRPPASTWRSGRCCSAAVSGCRFDGLVIATGASPKRLPGTDHLDGVHTLRTLDDCLEIRAALDATPRRVAVVGAGFIGAEVAATCRGRGIDVSLIEALPVPLERGLGPRDGCGGRRRAPRPRRRRAPRRRRGADRRRRPRRAHPAHRRRGARHRPRGGRHRGDARTPTGSTAPASRSTTAWCAMPPARRRPGVVAAGDVARWPNARFDEVMRVEHWDNAIAMGTHAAQSLLAGERGAALRPDPVVLVGPVRPQDPAGRARRRPTITSRWCPGRSRSGASWRSTGATAGWSASSA